MEGGEERVAVLSDAFWRTNLGGDPTILGRTLRLDGEALTVIGIMPPHFETPFAPGTQVWTPLTWGGPWLQFRGRRTILALGRLKPGVSHESARNEVSAIGRQLAATYPVDADYEMTVADLEAEVVARQIAAAVGGKKSDAEFDGRGYCWLELGDGRAGFAGGNFYVEPNPQLTTASLGSGDSPVSRDDFRGFSGILTGPQTGPLPPFSRYRALTFIFVSWLTRPTV